MFTNGRRLVRAGVMSVAGVVALAGVHRVGAAALPDQTIPQSFSVQLKAGEVTGANMDKTLDAVKALGLKYVRRGFYWQSIEEPVGTYNFADGDVFVKACKERGLSIVGTIVFSHKAYGQVYEAKGRAGYAKYAAALAGHYKGAPILWELWNEPNVQTFWGKHGQGHNSQQYADEYTALVKATVPAMKRADPACFVMAGSVSGLWTESFKWQAFCFKMGILSSGIDAWSVHPYSTKNPEDYVAAYALVRKLMKDDGGKVLPILNTERGYPISKKEGFSGGDPKQLAEYQAWHVVRQYLVDQLCQIKLTNWYEWAGNESFGLMKGSKQMPAYDACKVLIEQLSGYRLDKRIKLASDRDFVLRYVNKDGAVKLVAWTSPPAGGAPNAAKPHKVAVRVGASGAVNVIGIYGKKLMAQGNGKSLELELTGAPQYVSLSPAK